MEYDPDQIQSPGDMLCSVVRDLDITHDHLVERLEVASGYYWRIVNKEARLSEELAGRLERWTKIPAWVWLRQDQRWFDRQEVLKACGDEK
jgi:plasmid maintenance system antidote protein VapI